LVAGLEGEWGGEREVLARCAGTFDQSGAPSLLDQYEYAMYGKLYKWKQEHPKAPVYALAHAQRAAHSAHRAPSHHEHLLACRGTLTPRPHPVTLEAPPPLCPRPLAPRRAVGDMRTRPSLCLRELCVSFGGLLMRLRGDPFHLEKLTLDSRVYCLVRKIAAT
jgi:hypothetical protein